MSEKPSLKMHIQSCAVVGRYMKPAAAYGYAVNLLIKHFNENATVVHIYDVSFYIALKYNKNQSGWGKLLTSETLLNQVRWV